MRILLAEDDPVVGDSYEEALRAGYNSVYRTVGVDDTIGVITDGEAETVILDVQLSDGTAWEVLDRVPSAHPPFRVSVVTAVDAAPPLRWAHIPLYRKPLDHRGLMKAVAEAVPYERTDHEEGIEAAGPNWLERLLLADEPPLLISIPLSLVAIALVTLAMIFIREEAVGAISASYTVVVLLIAAYAGMSVGIAGGVIAFLAYNFFTVPPYYTFEIASAPLVLNLLAFLAAAIIGSILIGTGRSLARRRASEAALTRLRLQLLSQTLEVSSSQLIPVVTRVVKEALATETTLALLPPEADTPDWVPAEAADQARSERRTIETRGARTILLLPVDRSGLLLAVASAAGSRISD
ncbi:MAG TPA: DUF4118 domain-containing protein, partial [Acidimicrobiia bacterium]